MRSRRTAAIALVVLVLLLLLGMQMPGAWRDQALQSTHLPWQVNPLAHFTAFAAMAWLASAPPLRWPLARVLLGALALALLSEGLQYFAAGRHPTWRDVGIDMAGAALGLALARWRRAN